MFSPVSIITTWLHGLLTIAVLAGGIYLTYLWHDRLPDSAIVVRETENGPMTETQRLNAFVHRVTAWRPDWDSTTAMFAGALLLLAWSTAGGWVFQRLFYPAGNVPARGPDAEVQRISRQDGTVLHVESFGPLDAPRLIFTHGWGCDRQVWRYAINDLARRYRIVTWDLPGLGLSTEPVNRDYSLEKMATDLRAVLEATGDQPAVLVGHSIGGMITLTLCKLFPDLLNGPVVGISIAHSTYTNPLRTTRYSSLLTAIQKPIVEPLLFLTVMLSPLIWIVNCMSYLNGSTHRSTARDSFAGTQTRGQLDFAARYILTASPAVIARGMQGMLRYDVTGALSQIKIPAQLVVGDQDGTTLPDAGSYIDRHLPDSNLRRLAPAKHLGFFEQHDRFNDELRQFASTCVAQATNLAVR